MFLLVGAFCLSSVRLTAQTEAGNYKFIDANFAIGDSEGSLALSLNYDMAVGKRKKIIIGLAGRLTSYFGKNQYYVTAPAELTSGSTGPGVLFKENIEANMDSFLIKTSQVNCFNLALTLGYNLSKRVLLRFNIDAIGFSFGKSVNGNYINGNEGSMEPSTPTAFNFFSQSLPLI